MCVAFSYIVLGLPVISRVPVKTRSVLAKSHSCRVLEKGHNGMILELKFYFYAYIFNCFAPPTWSR